MKELDFGKKYIANQLQQLRKNSALLLKKDDLSDNQRELLKAVFRRVDSDLVTKKGYDHSKLPELPAKLSELPAPKYVPPPPPDDEGFVYIDLDANMPVPKPDLPPAPKPQSEEDQIGRAHV